MQSKLEELKAVACKLFNLEADEVQLWDYYSKNRHTFVDNCLSKSLSEAQIMDKQDILLQEKVIQTLHHCKSLNMNVVDTRSTSRTFQAYSSIIFT